jgi:hypothetical protein
MVAIRSGLADLQGISGSVGWFLVPSYRVTLFCVTYFVFLSCSGYANFRETSIGWKVWSDGPSHGYQRSSGLAAPLAVSSTSIFMGYATHHRTRKVALSPLRAIILSILPSSIPDISQANSTFMLREWDFNAHKNSSRPPCGMTMSSRRR